MSVASITEALNAKLLTYESVNIAWPNVHYAPKLGVGYLAPRISARTRTGTGEGQDGVVLHQGFYDIAIYEPIGDGVSYLLTKADAIADLFKKGTSLVHGGMTVICEVPTITPEQPMSGWIQVVVRVPWFVHEFPS